MRLLDRYLIRSFLAPFLFCLFAFMVLFIVYDVSVHLDDIRDAGVKLSTILRYHLFHVPILFVTATPVAILLAILYSLGNLSRHNEVIAMRASGVSLYRIMVPFFMMGLLLTLCVYVVQERYLPHALEVVTTTMKKDIKQQEEDADIPKWDDFSYQVPDSDRYWEGSYDPKKRAIRDLTIREFHPEGGLKIRISAREGRWVDGSWWLMDGKLARQEKGEISGKVREFKKMELKKELGYTENPEHFALSEKQTQFMSYMELTHYIRSRLRSKDRIHRERVNLNLKIAFPVTCIIVVMLGIPFGITTSRSGIIAGVGICIALVVSYYVITFFSIKFGSSGMLAPWFAAWFPNILYGIVGIIMVVKAR